MIAAYGDFDLDLGGKWLARHEAGAFEALGAITSQDFGTQPAAERLEHYLSMAKV